jgi:hypothetical protein
METTTDGITPEANTIDTAYLDLAMPRYLVPLRHCTSPAPTPGTLATTFYASPSVVIITSVHE